MKVSDVVLFEDEGYCNFLPLTYTRPVFDLRCGITTLWEKIARSYSKENLTLLCRDYLYPIFIKKVKGIRVNNTDYLNKKNCLFINGRVLGNVKLTKEIPLDGKEEVGVCDEEIAYARLSSSLLKLLSPLSAPLNLNMWDKIKKKVVVKKVDLNLLKYPWEVINNNPDAIRDDFKMLKKKSAGKVDKFAVIYNKQDIYIGKGSQIEATVVLDARGGPIYIGENVTIYPHTRIEGPSCISDGSMIVGGKIREGTTIGPTCRIGGEVEESIIHGFSNKYHDGFIGHAYVGEWVNLGALTTNSDLKDTYGDVKVTIGNERVSGGLKVGCFIGDYVKTSIGTFVYTGKTIGVASHVHGHILENVPSFTMWAKTLGTKPVELLLDSAIQVQARSFSRRKIEQTKEDIELLHRLFEITKKERESASVTEGKFAF